MKTGKWYLTREKHLDHMVRVVPFIVFCYAVQCFMIMKISPGEFSQTSLMVLGGFLAMMIGGFISYDLKHTVELSENELCIRFFSSHKTVKYEDIWEVLVSEPGQSFATVTLKTQSGNFSFYFIDDAEKVKAWLEEKRKLPSMAA